MSPHRLRNAAAAAVRTYFSSQGLLEVITPLLVQSPAIEPHLDAFSVLGSERRFFLPTSPEFGLKKTLALEPVSTSGVFEIAHAFRDDQPSRLHAAEFTMIEWYRRGTHYLDLVKDIQGIIQSILTLYNKTAPEVQLYTVQEYCEIHRVSIPPALVKLFENSNLLYSVESGGDSLAEAEVLAREFEVFFDEYIQPQLRQEQRLICLYGFPAVSRGMAKLDAATGLACRIECFYRGVELANGYQEISEPEIVEQLFIQCNKIRAFRGLPPYPMDETLHYLTPAMQGVAGMALGLERTLMAFFGIGDIASFALG